MFATPGADKFSDNLVNFKKHFPDAAMNEWG